jgi:hypothetical protein
MSAATNEKGERVENRKIFTFIFAIKLRKFASFMMWSASPTSLLSPWKWMWVAMRIIYGYAYNWDATSFRLGDFVLFYDFELWIKFTLEARFVLEKWAENKLKYWIPFCEGICLILNDFLERKKLNLDLFLD